MTHLEDEIRTIVAEISGLPSDFACDADLYLDMGVASIHAMELLLQLEEQYLINIPDDRFVEARTVVDLANVVSSLQGLRVDGLADA